MDEEKKNLCDICKKEIATVFYTIIVNNKKMQLNLCEKCAAKKGLVLSLQDTLTLPENTQSAVIELKCPSCGLTFEEFKNTLRLGCAECYNVFDREITAIAQRVHKATQHIGKFVKSSHDRIKIEHDINALKRKLEECLKNERYEEAAKIRDELRQLKKQYGIR